MSAPVRRLLIAFSALYLGLYLAWLVTGAAREQERYLVGNLALIFSSSVCTWMSIRAWRDARSIADDAARRAWRWISTGLAVWLSADALRMLQEWFVERPPGQPDLLDLVFMVGSLAILTGLLLYPRRALALPPRRRLRLLLDAAVATAAILCLSWIVVLAPIAASAVRPLALLYPAADLILLLVLMNLFLLNEAGTFPPPLSWLVVGLAAYAASDLTYAYLLREGSYAAGSLVDFGWTVGDGLILLASTAQIRRYSAGSRRFAAGLERGHGVPRRIAERLQTLLPLVATLTLGWVSILYWQISGPTAQLGPWATIVLSLVIIARQGIAAGEVEFEQYARLVDSIAEPAFICDREGILRLVNPAFTHITGHTLAQSLLGLPLQLLLRPAQDVRRILNQGLQPAQSGFAGWSGTIVLSRKDGQAIPIQLSLRPVAWGRGGLALAGTAHDLSESNRQQAALQQAYEQLAAAHIQLEILNSQLEQRVLEKTADLKDAYDQLEKQNSALRSLDRLKSDFVSMVSHELRAPLTNINGGIELVLARARPLNSTARETLALVQAEITRLTRFIETILDLSALDAGRAPVYPAPLRIPDVVSALRRQILHLPGEERIEWRIPPSLPEFLADERATLSILFHLLDNALKYAPSGVIRVSAGAGGNLGWIRVEDEGEGIPAEDLPLLFTRFFRSHSSDAQTVYGHGLGLYIVKRLLEAMDGTIEAANRPEGGACFICRLPLVMDEGTGEENELQDFAG